MSLESRLPPDLTLEQRATEINRLFAKIYTHEQQIERLRWRVAIELHDIQKRVLAIGWPWEKWCLANLDRSLGDIRKLLKMAAAHDPEAAHEAEKADTKAARRKREKDSSADQRASMRALADAQQPPAAIRQRDAGRAYAARQMIRAVLSKHSISEVRGWFDLIDIHDLIEALDAEASPHRDVTFVSTATH
jgi:hypothetical protein